MPAFLFFLDFDGIVFLRNTRYVCLICVNGMINLGRKIELDGDKELGIIEEEGIKWGHAW